ncbi:hypothetical protein L593_06885 [Salinarchaeum sp. Harcht-Bsk1]|uniref:DUF7266 family protein n=1 Tax=Salinarchaeum sp. Harcht-Bsk1 TaxID=1333523 RepID=UPI00034244C8|nr:hypothetical protein [Salinarchaeum sp. Harcht-Bsk1]AGN01324.1 hypothetical protein L593_06885 [Salinarchaeum sp. Harcht-Bsk1]
MRGSARSRGDGTHLRRGGTDRALSAVVGKTLEAGIVVLYISMLIGVLYGGVVPEYQQTTGAELGERVLAESVLEVQSAVPADPDATATVRGDLPRSIDNDPYRIVASNASIELVHEDPAIGGEVPLAMPSDVIRVEGEWESTASAVVRVETTPAGRVVRLEAGSA